MKKRSKKSGGRRRRSYPGLVARYKRRGLWHRVNRANGKAETILAGIFLAITTGDGEASEGYHAFIRGWHGSIHARFACVDNFLQKVQDHPAWPCPPALIQRVIVLRDKLVKLIPLCESTGSSMDLRAERDEALDEAVKLCRGAGQSWAHEMFAEAVMTAKDVHSLGFLLLGEAGGTRERGEPTKELALTKVEVRNADFVEVVVDQSAGENAAQVTHGWPPGVKQILIVIKDIDGKTELFRQMSKHQHNQFEMPAGSHGKRFIATAAFLKHVDDKPQFGNEEIFAMPVTVSDLMADHERVEHDNLANLDEIERLKAALEAERKKNEQKEQG
jgi:hypothetical protein